LVVESVTKSPWDDVDLQRSQHDLCACGHDRSVHTVTEDRCRCWSCHILGLHAPAFPDHPFHLVWPFNPPVQTPAEAERYQPPPGWDLPSSNRDREPTA
jgi:hypothetical protein